ncbi:MAG: hypothetical protein QOE91_778 [Gaiellaceae bacterium]|jgi:hypothetical protein|nr:hypothetical protein [Gaiellaceae bacterium]
MKIAHSSTHLRRATAVLAAALLVGLAAAQVAEAKPITGCSLLRLSEVRTTLGSPAALTRGGSISECIIRGGDHLPIVLLANRSGIAGYKGLLGAAGVPLKALRNTGTQAVTYDHEFQDPQGVARGVIIRKGSLVLQLTVNDVGPNPPGLPTVAQLVKLARAALPRLK